MIELAILTGALFWAIDSMVNKVFSWKRWQIMSYCLTCFSFWITTIITLNPLIGAGAALTVYLIQKNDRIEL
jgi:hypothetical protein